LIYSESFLKSISVTLLYHKKQIASNNFILEICQPLVATMGCSAYFSL